MARRRSGDKIVCRYFSWILVRRGRFFQADGRSNPTNAGRHSIQTADRDDAIRQLQELDLCIAIEFGLTKAEDQPSQKCEEISLEDGRDLYFEYVSRPRVMGGATPATKKRYRPVFEKFLLFAHRKGVKHWNRVNGELLQAYAADLVRKGYADRTLYCELTTLKQAIGWLIKTKRLAPDCAIDMPLDKPQGTSTYCWTHEQVWAMIEYCQQRKELQWLEAVVVALASTGLRIGELTGLRWCDLQLSTVPQMIHLVDETAKKQPRGRSRRTTKSGRDRTLPLFKLLSNQLGRISRHSDGYVFHGPKGGRLKPDTVRRVLIRDVLKPLEKRFKNNDGDAGFRDGRLHSFRHYFCTLCVDINVPMNVVMAWLGHSDSRMVRHYYHLRDAESRRHSQAMDKFFEMLGTSEQLPSTPETPGNEKSDLGPSEQ